MSRGAQTFRERDVTKAVKALQKAGVKVKRVEIADGKIVVFAEQPEVIAIGAETPEELHKLL